LGRPELQQARPAGWVQMVHDRPCIRADRALGGVHVNRCAAAGDSPVGWDILVRCREPSWSMRRTWASRSSCR